MKMPSSCRSRWVAGPSGVSKSAIGAERRREEREADDDADDRRRAVEEAGELVGALGALADKGHQLGGVRLVQPERVVDRRHRARAEQPGRRDERGEGAERGRVGDGEPGRKRVGDRGGAGAARARERGAGARAVLRRQRRQPAARQRGVGAREHQAEEGHEERERRRQREEAGGRLAQVVLKGGGGDAEDVVDDFARRGERSGADGGPAGGAGLEERRVERRRRGRHDGRCGAADEAGAWRGGGGEEDGKQHLNSMRTRTRCVIRLPFRAAAQSVWEEREPRPTMQRIWSPWTKRGAHAARYTARLRLHGAWPISRLLRPLR